MTQEEIDEINRRSAENQYSLLGNIGETIQGIGQDAFKMFAEDPGQALGQAAGIAYGAATNDDMGLDDMWNLLDEEEKATIMAEGAGFALAPIGGKLISRYGDVPIEDLALGVNRFIRGSADDVVDEIPPILDDVIPGEVVNLREERWRAQDLEDYPEGLPSMGDDDLVFDALTPNEIATLQMEKALRAQKLKTFQDEQAAIRAADEAPNLTVVDDSDEGIDQLFGGRLGDDNSIGHRQLQENAEEALREASRLRNEGFFDDAKAIEDRMIDILGRNTPEASPAQLIKNAEMDAEEAARGVMEASARGDKLSQMRDRRASRDQNLRPANNNGALSMDEFATTLDDQSPAVQSEFLSRYKEIQDLTLEEEELLGLTAKKFDPDHPAFETQAGLDHKQAEELLQARIDDMLAFIRDNNK